MRVICAASRLITPFLLGQPVREVAASSSEDGHREMRGVLPQLEPYELGLPLEHAEAFDVIPF
jgi:hypothetical protein